MKTTILVENSAPDGLIAEHGLALWLETPSGAVLFDTGQGKALAPNAQALGIDLGQARSLVLSHGHYDHTGAVPYALEQMQNPAVFCHHDIFLPRYSIHPGKPPRTISLPDKSYRALQQRLDCIHWVRAVEEILPGLYITGPIPRIYPFEDVGGPFFLDPAGFTPDFLQDDQALWTDTPQGLEVALGCCHAGLLNTLSHIRRLEGLRPIHRVTGGMHLADATDERLEKTARQLREWDIHRLHPCHCTGQRAIDYLVDQFPGRVHPFHTGDTF